MEPRVEPLSDAELAAVVSGTNVHQVLREKTGMCGCGVFPGDGLHQH